MAVSVVIRALDEAEAIGATLDALARQTVAHEVVVVDSGSSDGTAAIAAGRGARVVSIASDRFTFGRALNLGVREAASASEVVVALSAHAVPEDDGWLARVAAWFEDPRVACAFGETADPAFAPLQEPVRQDAAMARATPYWGYSNGAGAFRRSLWERRAFREDMPGSEDREWALWALTAFDAVCVLDPALAVAHDHSGDGLRTSFDRYAREARGFALYLGDELPPYGVRALAREWWSDQGGHRSRARARLDPRRAVRLAGKWWGRRTPRPDARWGGASESAQGGGAPDGGARDDG